MDISQRVLKSIQWSFYRSRREPWKGPVQVVQQTELLLSECPDLQCQSVGPGILQQVNYLPVDSDIEFYTFLSYVLPI